MEIPKLATGAIIPPENFNFIHGSPKEEREVICPGSTLFKEFEAAIESIDFSVPVTINLDGNALYEAMKRPIKPVTEE